MEGSKTLLDAETLFLVTDVSGKGIPAALIVSTIDAVLNSYLNINKAAFNLHDLVRTMNVVLINTTTVTQFATAWFGLYNHNSCILQTINAGHNPPYLFRKSHPVQSIEKGGIFLGMIDTPYEQETVNFENNDTLVFYTDGVTEAWNHREEDYGETRLIQIISENLKNSSQDILNAIQKDVNQYIAGLPLNDNFTCGVIKKTIS